jgi:hypothetical protein
MVFLYFLMASGDICHCYIMPAEQLLDFMAKNFSGFRTVVITQSTLRTDSEGEGVFKEQVLMKSPDFFHLKALDPGSKRPYPHHTSYRQLLIATTGDRIMRLLLKMGLNPHIVAFTRIDGIIAYRIGEKGPETPKLLIEKERFIPLLFVYRAPGNPEGETISVRFLDYRKQDKGWYPFEISVATEDGIKERSTVLSLQINAPVSSSLLEPFRIRPDPAEQTPETGSSDLEDERLRKIIKAFEEKYR